MPEQAIRFGVRNPAGTLSSTIWTLDVSGRAGLCLATRTPDGTLQMSMHADGLFYIQLVRDRVDELSDETHKPPRRVLEGWQPSSIPLAGLVLAARIWVSSDSVTKPIDAADFNRIKWVLQPDQGRMREFMLFISDSAAAPGTWPGRNAMRTELMGSAPLPDGRVAWIVWRDLPVHLPQIPNQLSASAEQSTQGGDPHNAHLHQVRMLTWGFDERKSAVFFETLVMVERDSVNR